MSAETFRIEIPIHVEDKTDPGVSQATRKINKFDEANQRTQERLNQMNKTKYQVVLDALDRASSVVGKVSTKARSIAGKTFSFTMKVIDLATAPLRALWNFATSIQGAILGATGAFAGIYQPMEIAADFEQTQISFETMLKSAEKAQQFLKEASEFANKTPFEFPELINSSKLLMAFGFEADKVLDMLKTIGDTASGLGAGSEGIDRITRALGQMQAKGRVQTEELLQLQELGVPANQILQEELGLTGEQIANIGKESIEASKAIDALLRGMEKRFGGMMANQSRTAKGMISTIKDTLQNSLLRQWGEGLWAGIKPGLERLTNWIVENQDTIAEWGEAWKKAGENISKWVMARVEDLRSSIQRMTNSQEWKDAETFGEKLKIAWDKIIAQPFNEWWNSTGKAWLADKASKIGEGIGTALSAGLLAILGIDAKGAVEDGTSIGASFAEGFLKGFDGKKVGEAILNAIKGVFKDAGTLLPGGEEPTSTSWLSATLLTFLGIKGAKGISTIFKGGKGIYDFGKRLFKGSKAADAAGDVARAVSTAAGTVDNASDIAKTTKNLKDAAAGFGDEIPKGLSGKIKAAEKAVAKGRVDVKKEASHLDDMVNLKNLKAIDYANAREGFVVAKDVANAAKVADKAGDVAGKTGIFSKIAGWFGKSGDDVLKAGSKAAGKGIKGIPVLGTILGLTTSGAVVASATPENRGREAAGEVGSWLGSIGAGASAGALVGTLGGGPIGTAVGGIVGGIGGAIGGEAFTEWLYDQKDTIGDFFTDTLPKGWNDFWGGVGDFFTSSVPNWWGGLTDKVSSFFTETIPEKWGEFWGGVGDFFTETVPYALGYAAGKIEVFFTEDVPEFFGNLWNGLSTFFTSTLPTWASDVWNGNIVPFFTQDIPNFFGGIWSNITTFFTSTLPTWAADTWNNKIVPFFTQDIPNFFGGLWTGVTTFFTSTLPTWAANTWNNNILPFFTQTIPGFFGSLWGSISGFFTQTLPTLASNIWGSIKSFFTDTIPSFFGDLWDKVKRFFGAGYEAGKGSSVQEHAYGGIITKPHIGLVAEDGPEGIIPLSPSKRQRGLDLWQRTGELLGVRAYEVGALAGAGIGGAAALFTGNKAGKALSDASDSAGGEEASSTSWLSAGAIALALQKLGVFKLIGKGGKGLTNLFGKGSKSGTPDTTGILSAYSTDTMYVTDVYGKTIQDPGGGTPTGGGSPLGGYPSLPTVTKPPALPPAGGSPLALPGAAGKVINTVQLANGTYVATGGALATGLAKTGVALGSGATTAGGAIAAGGSSVLGGALGIAGLGAGAVDIYQGTKKTGKEAKDEYFQGGTKIGMVGAGAGIGAAVGSVVPVIGTGDGGIVGEEPDEIPWQSFKSWLVGLGQKGSKETGLTTSQGKGSILEHAYGGIMTKPHMGIVAEDGAESIIPLSPSKRQRGLDLWQRTGELLGVRAYEDGGIVGEEPDEIPVASATGKAGQNITIKVEVKAEPKFTIDGSGDNTDENKVVAVLKAYIREMTDDIGDELAERLARIFANMPVKGGAEA